MFLQKLKLDPKKSYKTSVELQNLIENLHLSFKHIPVLTPFSSKSEPIEDVKSSLSCPETPSSHFIDCATFLELSPLFDSTHVILTEPELFSKFCIDLSPITSPFIIIGQSLIREPVIGGPVIGESLKEESLIREPVIGESITNIPTLQLNNFSINYKGEDAYVALFILTRLFKGTVISRRTERVKIFLKALGVEWEVVKSEGIKSVKSEGIKSVRGECVVVMDGCVGEETVSEVERVFWIGSFGPGSTAFELDLKAAGKYKCRIGDLYRAITPAVMKGVKRLDYLRFKKMLI